MITLPASFSRDGFTTLEAAVRPPSSKFRRLMIGTDGPAGTGKSEFLFSCPGPAQAIIIDRGIDSLTNNPDPPAARRGDIAAKIIYPPIINTDPKSKAPQVVISEFVNYWVNYRDTVYKALDNPDSRGVYMDGDSDAWEIQKMAEFGKLLQIPPHMNTGVNAARRAFYSRMWASNKVIVCTNKVKKEYDTVLDDKGNPKKDDAGNEKREWTGNYERQGFADMSYLFQIQLTHLYKPAMSVFNSVLKRNVDTPQQWGIRINMCKSNRAMEGLELWGSDACFRGLVETVFPHIDPKEWGY